jgi:phosphohistidine phosphatase
MDRLILIRHAKTEARAPSGEDFDRALTPRGLRDARLTAEALADAGFEIDRALVSAAVRARQTWEVAAEVFPRAVIETRPELYDADARTLLAAGRTPLGRSVAMIAHNPGLQILAIALAARAEAPSFEARLRRGFATGAAAVYGFDGEAVEALGLLYPADYGGGPD